MQNGRVAVAATPRCILGQEISQSEDHLADQTIHGQLRARFLHGSNAFELISVVMAVNI